MGDDSALYARAHSNIGLGVDQDRAVQEEQERYKRQEGTEKLSQVVSTANREAQLHHP